MTKSETIESNPVAPSQRTSSAKIEVSDIDLAAVRSNGAVYEKRRSSIHSDDIPSDPVAQQEFVMKLMEEKKAESRQSEQSNEPQPATTTAGDDQPPFAPPPAEDFTTEQELRNLLKAQPLPKDFTTQIEILLQMSPLQLLS